MKKILLLIISAFALTGCIGNRSAESGLEDTLKSFHAGLCKGEFCEVLAMCDTLHMKEYINTIRQAWTSTDESVKAILPAILSDTEIEITDIIKNGQDRTIFYKLTATDGQSKEKIATLRREEGEWKITAITDKH